MRAVAEQLGDVVGVAVEVDAAVSRRCSETAPVDEDQAVLLRERPLLAERLLTPAKAAVHEDRRLAVTPHRDVNTARRAHAPSLRARSYLVSRLPRLEQRRLPAERSEERVDHIRGELRAAAAMHLGRRFFD